jgi:hypothetical protein
VLSQPSLPPSPSAGCNGTREECVELSTAGSGLQGGLVRPPHLSQNLGFTQDLGVESGRNLIEVPNARGAIAPRDRCARVGPTRARQPAKPGLEIMPTPPVHLESAAGLEDGGATASGSLLTQNCDCGCDR